VAVEQQHGVLSLLDAVEKADFPVAPGDQNGTVGV